MSAWKTPEDEYIHSLEYGGKGPSLREIAERWGFSHHLMRRRASAEHWTHKRAQYLSKMQQKWEISHLAHELSKLEQVDQQADPLYEMTMSLIGGRLEKIERQVEQNADEVDARELDTLMSASLKAHNQRRLIYGGVTERKEDRLTGADGGPIKIMPVRDRIAERLAQMAARQDVHAARDSIDSNPISEPPGNGSPRDPE